MRLLVTEEVEYEIETDDIYEGVRDFMRSPNDYITGVVERSYSIQTSEGGEPFKDRLLTDEEQEEMTRAEEAS